MLGPAARFWISTVQRYRLRRHLLISFLTDLLIFYRVHGRLPKRDSYLINDIWFWIKADRDGIALTPFTDKETAKSFIAGIAGADMVPETYAILRGEAELRAFRCDRPYVAKPTHTSGGAVIKPHGGPLTEAEVADLTVWLDKDYFLHGGENQYRKLAPKIIVEQYISADGKAAPDVKFTCYRGECLFALAHMDRFTNHRNAFFTPDWRRIDNLWEAPSYEGDIPAPPRLNEMVSIAQKIASHFKLSRIDFLVTADRFYIGEITFSTHNAHRKFIRPETEDVRYFMSRVESARKAA